MLRILYDDWSIRLGENRSDQSLKSFLKDYVIGD